METLQRTANRGSISTGFDIDNSVKLEPDNSESFNKTFGSAGNRKTWSYSCWIKKTELFSSNGGALISAYPDVNNRLKIAFSQHKIQVFGKVSGSTTVNVRTNRLYRDTSAFYHILVVFDTTQGTAANRVKIYTNGVLEDSFDQTTYPSQNNDEEIGNSSAHYIGQRGDGSSDFYAGYITEINYVNGQALAPTEFGEFDEDSGIWKPKAYTGSYGTNGFYLDFKDASNLGDDESGNGNDFTETNITAADQATDTPTNNFAILSQSMQGYYEDLWSVISEGGTKFRCTEFDAFITAVSSIGVTKGKWYAEFKYTGARPNNFAGIASMEQLDNNSGYIYGGYLGEDGETWSIGYYQSNGKLYVRNNAGSSTTASWGAAVSQNQTVGVALDMDNHKLYFSVNGTYQNSGDPTSGATGTGAISIDDTETVAIATSGYSLGSGNDTINEANFGGFSATSTGFTNTDGNGYGTFAYAPPSGYYALCTKNLAEYG